MLRDFLQQDAVARGPGLFWPAPVRLVEPLPEDVTGTVWMRTSPFAVAKSPERILDPLGPSPNPMEQERNFNQFRQALQGWFNTSAREQVPLAAELTGTFGSAFRGKAIPNRPGEASDESTGDEEPEDSVQSTEGAGEHAAANADLIGPEPPPELATDDAAGASAPVHLDRSELPGQLVVIGDADFLRDDLVDGTYQAVGGPISPLGTLFFVNLIDQLMQDTDLIELRTRSVRDRALSFVAEDPNVSLSVSELAQARRRKEKTILWFNILIPPALLLGVGLLVLLRRAAQKRAFLGSLQDS